MPGLVYRHDFLYELRKEVMEASAKNGFTNATDAADYLVNKGVPFRDAHGTWDSWSLLALPKELPWMISAGRIQGHQSGV